MSGIDDSSASPSRQAAELDVALGRLNAIQLFCAVLARALPQDIASKTATDLEAATSRVEADATASPIPDAMLDEMLRVSQELLGVLRHAAASRG